jgi:hypothetical protein
LDRREIKKQKAQHITRYAKDLKPFAMTITAAAIVTRTPHDRKSDLPAAAPNITSNSIINAVAIKIDGRVLALTYGIINI